MELLKYILYFSDIITLLNPWKHDKETCQKIIIKKIIIKKKKKIKIKIKKNKK